MGKKGIARSLLPAVADDKFPLVQSLVLVFFSELVTKHCVAENTTKAKRRCLNKNDPVIVLIAMKEFKDFNGIEEDLLDDLEGIAEACTCSQKTHRSQARQIAERWLAKAKELEEEKATKVTTPTTPTTGQLFEGKTSGLWRRKERGEGKAVRAATRAWM